MSSPARLPGWVQAYRRNLWRTPVVEACGGDSCECLRLLRDISHPEATRNVPPPCPSLCRRHYQDEAFHHGSVTCLLVVHPVLFSGGKDQTGNVCFAKCGRYQPFSWVFLSPCHHHVFPRKNPARHHLAVARAWDYTVKRPVQVFRGHTGAVNALLYVRGVFYTASDDATVRAWHLTDGTCAQVCTPTKGW